MVARVGRPLVINPGSAGQARDHSNGKRLSYAVLDRSLERHEVTADAVAITDYDVPARPRASPGRPDPPTTGTYTDRPDAGRVAAIRGKATR